VALDLRIMRVVLNQEIEIAVSPVDKSAGNYASDVKFKLLPSGEYTRLVFTAQTDFTSLSDRIFEPLFTFATKRKLREDLSRLKLSMEADTATQSTVHARGTAREAAKPARPTGATTSAR